MTIGGIVLFVIIVGTVVAIAEVNSTSTFPHETALLAYAKPEGVAHDALPILTSDARWVEVLDPQGKLLSRHLLRTDKLEAGVPLLNVSDLEEASELNEQVLRELLAELAKRAQGDRVPASITARIAVLDDTGKRLQINSVSASPQELHGSTGRTRIIASPVGLFRLTTTASSVPGEIEVTVSQVN
jgi:hypothetical protein